MNGKHQMTQSISINVGVQTVWGVVADSSLLGHWVPAVDEVVSVTGPEGVGATRECNVDFSGRKGVMVERCVEFVPNHIASYVVDRDTLGFGRMFADYGFSLTLEPTGPATTSLCIDTYYTPRNAIYTVLNAVLLRRKFTTVVQDLLSGLKQFSERRAVA